MTINICIQDSYAQALLGCSNCQVNREGRFSNSSFTRCNTNHSRKRFWLSKWDNFFAAITQQRFEISSLLFIHHAKCDFDRGDSFNSNNCLCDVSAKAILHRTTRDREQYLELSNSCVNLNRFNHSQIRKWAMNFWVFYSG